MTLAKGAGLAKPKGTTHHGAITAGELLYQRLRDDILFAVLRPNDRLTLGPVSERYGASVPTIREVLNRLTSEALVVAEGQKGFRVAPVSAKGLRELAHARLLLEADALRQSIASGGIEWEAAIISAHHKLWSLESKMLAGNEVEVALWKQYDREFHFTIISACDSDLILQMHKDVFDKFFRYLALALGFRGKVAVEEHENIKKHALMRDADAAVSVLTAHIENGVAQAIARGTLAGS